MKIKYKRILFILTTLKESNVFFYHCQHRRCHLPRDLHERGLCQRQSQTPRRCPCRIRSRESRKGEPTPGDRRHGHQREADRPYHRLESPSHRLSQGKEGSRRRCHLPCCRRRRLRVNHLMMNCSLCSLCSLCPS